jgi:hypothetical protein
MDRKPIRAIIAAVASSVVLAGTVSAATLYTPIIMRPSQGFQRCAVINVSTRTIEVTVELIQDTGELLSSATCHLAPGTGSCIVDDPNVSLAYCKFTTSAPSARAVRAAGYGLTSLGEVTNALPAH